MFAEQTAKLVKNRNVICPERSESEIKLQHERQHRGQKDPGLPGL